MRTNRSKVAAVSGLIALLAPACAPNPPAVVTPDTLPNGVVDADYSATLTVTGAGSPRWEVIAGTLPPGLVLRSETGTLEGKPTADGLFSFTVAAYPGPLPFAVAQASFSLTVIPALAADTVLPDARVGVAYYYQIPVRGGVPPYQLALVGLPAGLGFDSPTGIIAGTPVLPWEDLPLELTVIDAGQPRQQLTRALTLEIRPAPVRITTTQLSAAKLNSNYSAQLAAEGGLEPYEWRVVGGWLPDDLRLNRSSGAITGIPRSVGTVELYIQVLDGDVPQNTDTKSFTLTVGP